MSIINKDLLVSNLETYKVRQDFAREVSVVKIPAGFGGRLVVSDDTDEVYIVKNGTSYDLNGTERATAQKRYQDSLDERVLVENQDGTAVVTNRRVVNTTTGTELKEGEDTWNDSAVLINGRILAVNAEHSETCDEPNQVKKLVTFTEEDGTWTKQVLDTESLAVLSLDPFNKMAVLGFLTDVALCTIDGTTVSHHSHFEGFKLMATTRPTPAVVSFSVPSQVYGVISEFSGFTIFSRASRTAPIGNQITFPLPDGLLSVFCRETPTGCTVLALTTSSLHTFEVAHPTEPQPIDNGAVDTAALARINAVLSAGGEW
eukprot:TRINITY_DN2951_c0_g1_i1.p1 TRINITY_DN2951_c0_g1~~TRINITY_DN2951_c0_g1_i1.p1  ORF type:complete len:334 (+),score=56.69 TRINITY_DN2951_c0_g1_i1:55-1002(+)